MSLYKKYIEPISIIAVSIFVMPEVFNRASSLVPDKRGIIIELGSRFHVKSWISA
jgi:hypothetical protein